MNRLILGVLAAGTALGASALKNVEPHTTANNGRDLNSGYFVQQENGSYKYVSTITHAQGQCSAINQSSCAYRVPETNSIPNDEAQTYSKEQLEEDFGLMAANSNKGIWTPLGEN
jgi:hypothetical protein